MSYSAALDKTYAQLHTLNQKDNIRIRFLLDTYVVHCSEKTIVSLPNKVPAKEYISILLLHYALSITRGLPQPKGEWISFQELEGGVGYYPAFRTHSIVPIIEKYGTAPRTIVTNAKRFHAQNASYGDAGIIIEPFDAVPMLITIHEQDEEFPADANIVFDKSIKEIFPTEDIAVLSNIVARTI